MLTAERTHTNLKPRALGLAPSFGFGDRMGLATPGHVAALREAGGGIQGIFAQQSIREMTRTNRTPQEVMRAATEVLAACHYQQPWSADADHLKTPQDIALTAAAGFVFFTLDPSGEVDQAADNYSPAELSAKFDAVRQHAPWVDSYRGKVVSLPSGKIVFTPEALTRAAVKYGRAIELGISLGKCVAREAARLDQPYEIELSVDETPQPTSFVEHYIVADQFRQADVKLVSLAPRYVGDFEKGIDYKGDLRELEASLKVHAEIANELGPYKLSLHSGSDKLSLYPLLARITAGRFHVKTAGTSYLEALRVVALRAPQLFREVVEFSRGCYNQDKATYHVSAEVEKLPSASAVASDSQLQKIYLEEWPDVAPGAGFTALGRQVLHCTFGSVMTHPEFAPKIRGVLTSHPDDHREILRDHFVRHLRALQA